MANYRIKISYQVLDTDPNPDVVVYPSSSNTSQFQLIDAATAEEVKQTLITNASARVSSATTTLAREQAILDAINPPNPPAP